MRNIMHIYGLRYPELTLDKNIYKRAGTLDTITVQSHEIDTLTRYESSKGVLIAFLGDM